MNPSTVIGAAVGLLTLIIVVALAATDPGMYINLPGLAIVLGGTAAAVFIAYPLSEVLRVFKLVRTVFRNDQHDQQRDIEELVSMAQLWMNTDVRKVEQELKKVSNPFLRTGVQLIIDNTPEEIAELAIEMMGRLEGDFVEDPEDTQLQEEFRFLVKPHHHCWGAASRIGRAFLRRHKDMLGSHEHGK